MQGGAIQLHATPDRKWLKNQSDSGQEQCAGKGAKERRWLGKRDRRARDLAEGSSSDRRF